MVATPAAGMVFPPNEAVDNAVTKKRKRKASSTSTSASTSQKQFSSRYDGHSSPYHVFNFLSMDNVLNVCLLLQDLELDQMILFLSKLCTVAEPPKKSGPRAPIDISTDLR